MRYPIAIADMTCGMYAAMGILGALFAREKTGLGQFLDMRFSTLSLRGLANAGSSYLNANAEPRRWGNAHPNIVPYQVFRGRDEKYFVVGVGTEGLWKKFVDVLQAQASLGKDARFTSNPLPHRAPCGIGGAVAGAFRCGTARRVAGASCEGWHSCGADQRSTRGVARPAGIGSRIDCAN